MIQPRTLVISLCLASSSWAQLPTTMRVVSEKPAYQVGQMSFFTVRGTPQKRAFLFCSTSGRATRIPGLGVFCLDPFAPATLLVDLGTMPRDGKVILCDTLPCWVFFREFRVWMTALEGDAIRGFTGRSDCPNFLVVGGPCGSGSSGYRGLGLHTTFGGVTRAVSDLNLEVYEKSDKKKSLGSLKLRVDWANLPLMPFSVPGSNLLITYLELRKGRAVVQFLVSAANGQDHLQTTLAPCVILDGMEKIADLGIDHPGKPEVGMVLGPYTIIRIIDV